MMRIILASDLPLIYKALESKKLRKDLEGKKLDKIIIAEKGNTKIINFVPKEDK